MIVTGAAGYLGSCMVGKLNQHNFNYIIAVDEFGNPEMERNLNQKKILERVPTDQLQHWLQKNFREIEFIFHFANDGEPSGSQPYAENNSSITLSKNLWHSCVDYQIPLIFSISQSAQKTHGLLPQTTFGQWTLQQEKKPFFWVGIQIPQVYGPNEYYLKENASIIYRWFKQWQQDKNHGEDLSDLDLPDQDYVYVKDVVDICYFLMHHRQHSGLYPVGSGTLYKLYQVKEVFDLILNNQGPAHIPQTALHIAPENLSELRAAGYKKPLRSLQEGLSDYIVHYLQQNKYY